jgi:four helix bundle protein
MATFKTFEEIECWKKSREVRCQLYVALDQAYINEAEFTELSTMAEEVSRMIGGLIAYLRGSKYKGTNYKK